MRSLRARVGAYAIRPYSLPAGESRPDSLKRYGRNLFRAKDRQLHTFVNLFSARCSVLQRLTVPFSDRIFFGRKPITPIF